MGTLKSEPGFVAWLQLPEAEVDARSKPAPPARVCLAVQGLQQRSQAHPAVATGPWRFVPVRSKLRA